MDTENSKDYIGSNGNDFQSTLKPNVLTYVAYVGFLTTLSFYSIKQIISRMACELTYSFTWDSPIYWTVGRGYLNGLKPYVDLFETKSPGIFLLTAFSFMVSGDVLIGNIFCFICLMIIGLTPFISALMIYRKKLETIKIKSIIYIASLAFGAVVMLYSQIRSGQMQVESLGAAFICLYLLMVFNIKMDKVKFYSSRIFAASFCVMCGVMFKEPFILIAIASALLFINGIKEFVYKLVIPLCYGGVLGVIVLFTTGTLSPYLNIYLPHMTGNHVSIHGSPFERGKHIKRLLEDLGRFSGGVQTLIIVLGAAAILLIFVKIGQNKNCFKTSILIIYNLFKIPLMIYLVSFAVGLGGQYYNHHYVFAVPFYIALFMFLLLEIKPFLSDVSDEKKKNILPEKFIAYSFLAIVLVINFSVFYLLPDYQYDQSVLEANPVIRQQAKYVDGLLDHYGIQRYQYLGFNGNRFYGLTKHSPQGPLFIQDPNNFLEDNTWFPCQKS